MRQTFLRSGVAVQVKPRRCFQLINPSLGIRSLTGILSLLFWGTLPVQADAACAIAFDSASAISTKPVKATGVTFSHTVSGTKTFLLVQVYIQANGATDTVKTATYAGETMVMAMAIQDARGGLGSLETWYLVNPTPGTNDVIVTINDTKARFLHVGAVSYQGVDQTTPIGAMTTVNHQAANIFHSITLTTTQANSLIAEMFAANNTEGVTSGEGQTPRWLEGDNGATAGKGIRRNWSKGIGNLIHGRMGWSEGDELATTVAGPYTMSYTAGTAHTAAMEALEIIPVKCNTPTYTPTKTPTPTNSPTNSPTSTPTVTPTPTPTTVVFVNIHKTVSDTAPESNETLTYIIGLNVFSSTASNIIVTDTVPAGLKYIASIGSPSPPGTTLSTILGPTPGLLSAPGNGTLLVWSFPPVAPGNYGVTYTANVNGLTPDGTVINNQAAMNFLGNPIPQVVQAPVTVKGNFMVQINVYKKSKEIVKTILAMQYFPRPIRTVTIESSTLVSIKDKINLVNSNMTIGTWDGTNKYGEEVSNGNYHIKIENIDYSGSIDSIIQDVVVDRKLIRITLSIYNEAGEIIRHLDQVVSDAVTLNDNVTVSNPTIAPNYQGGATSTTSITLADGSGVTWDGRNDSGKIVLNGQYFIEIMTEDQQGGNSTVTKTINVTQPELTLPNGQVLVYPNPFHVRANGTQVNFMANANPPVTLKVNIYTLAGELVQRKEGQAGTSQLTWDLSGLSLASGMYLAVIEIYDSAGAMQRQITKLLIQN